MIRLQDINLKAVWLFLFLAIMLPQTISAKCGAVDYSMGAEQLFHAAIFVGTVTKYAVEILKTVAAIFSVISALQIAIKMNYHEGDITKSVVMLVGSLIFLIAATSVMPALFGYSKLTFPIN